MVFVSICTPTYNRRPFIPAIIECVKRQTHKEYEWVVVDDGTDPIEDLLVDLQFVKYVRLPEKVPLGKKRNIMHQHAKGEILVYMDDDDFYPATRVSHAVERLQANPGILVAGSSAMYLYFHHIQKIVLFGPYGKYHATAGTFAFRKKLLKQSGYEDDAVMGEEKVFLKNYTIPLVQLDPMHSILVFAHDYNTFDKKTLLERPGSTIMKYTDLKVSDFIPDAQQAFFYTTLHDHLKKFDARNSIVVNGRTLKGGEIVQFVSHQQAYIKQLEQRVKDLKKAKDESSKVVPVLNGVEEA
jgi:Glycosyl transferase family 2